MWLRIATQKAEMLKREAGSKANRRRLSKAVYPSALHGTRNRRLMGKIRNRELAPQYATDVAFFKSSRAICPHKIEVFPLRLGWANDGRPQMGPTTIGTFPDLFIEPIRETRLACLVKMAMLACAPAQT